MQDDLTEMTDIAAVCAAIGIDALGVVKATPLQSYDIYREIIARGVPPQLEYLARNADCRRDFDAILPGTKSIVCCACTLPVFRAETACRYARFCAFGDYHLMMREKMQKLDAYLRANYPIQNSRICVDSAPVLERELAVHAGLGDIGFNRMLIHHDFGSFIALAELFVDADLTECADPPAYHVRREATEAWIPGHHGCCDPAHRRCSSACPTGALSDHGYDMNKCLAYWTTQHKGDIPEPYATAMGEMIWGCDRCQNACPRNLNAPRPCVATSTLDTLAFDEILSLSARQLRKRLANSPLADANPHMLVRNTCIAIGNARVSKYSDQLGTIAATHTCDWVRRAAERALTMTGECS